MATDINSYQQRLVIFSSILNQKLRSYREAKRRLDRFLSTGFNLSVEVEPVEYDD
jgi:hypothetical protein